MKQQRYLYAGIAAFVLVAVGCATLSRQAQAHCQVPCGIYDDPARVARLSEDATTIAKCVNQINALARAHDGQGHNQLARWVATKEAHADHIIDTVAHYFLCQRVKPGSADYLKKLAEHHAVMVAAMKCKQSADPSAVDTLKQRIDQMGKSY